MVKPTVYAIDPSQKKAQEKAKEAGQVEVPIHTDKLPDELAVKTQEGARPRGCCGSMPRWQKITIGVIATLLILGGVGFLTRRMLIRNGWCGTGELERGHHRWDMNKGDFDGRYGEDGIPLEGGHRDGSHERGEDGHHDRPGSSSEEDGEHHGPHHGSDQDGDGPQGDSDHDGPHHGPNPGPHHGPHPGPHHGPSPRPSTHGPNEGDRDTPEEGGPMEGDEYL